MSKETKVSGLIARELFDEHGGSLIQLSGQHRIFFFFFFSFYRARVNIVHTGRDLAAKRWIACGAPTPAS